MESLILRAEELDLTDGDCAFSLVDSDCSQDKDALIAQADRAAKKCTGFLTKQIVSNPCFEVWYILHFDYTTAQYAKSNDVVQQLKHKYMPDYTKAKDGIYNEMRDRQDTACNNAKKLYQHCMSSNYVYHTSGFLPSTHMYILIQEIRRMAE